MRLRFSPSLIQLIIVSLEAKTLHFANGILQRIFLLVGCAFFFFLSYDISWLHIETSCVGIVN